MTPVIIVEDPERSKAFSLFTTACWCLWYIKWGYFEEFQRLHNKLIKMPLPSNGHHNGKLAEIMKNPFCCFEIASLAIEETGWVKEEHLKKNQIKWSSMGASKEKFKEMQKQLSKCLQALRELSYKEE